MAVHVLFLLDEYSEALGGAYIQQRGLIELLRDRYIHTDQTLTVSCTTTHRPPTQDSDINFIDLNADILEKLSEPVTHIVTFSSHCREYFAEGGIVQTLMQATPASPRLIVVNNDINNKILVAMNELPASIPVLVFSLVETCFEKVHNVFKLRNDHGRNFHEQLYPPVCTVRNLRKAAPELPEYTIIVFAASSPKEGFKQEFLQQILDGVESICCDAQNLGKKYNIKWKVYCEDEKAKEYIPVKLRPYVRLLGGINEEEFNNSMSLANLCIADGMFHSAMFSGLETLLSGVPTLVLKNSDVSSIIETVSISKSTFFTVDASSVSSALTDIIKRFLLEDNIPKAFKEAKAFAEEYAMHPKVTTSITKFLDVFPKALRRGHEASQLEPSAEQLGIQLRAQSGSDRDPDETSLKACRDQPSESETFLKVPVTSLQADGPSNTGGSLQADGPSNTGGSLQADGPQELLSTGSEYNHAHRNSTPEHINSTIYERERSFGQAGIGEPIINMVHVNGQRNSSNNQSTIEFNGQQDPYVFQRLQEALSQLSPTSPVFPTLDDTKYLNLSLPQTSVTSGHSGLQLLNGTLTLNKDCRDKDHRTQRKDFKSLSDSEGSSSEDGGVSLPRPITPPSVRPKKKKSQEPCLAFTTSRSSRSSLSKKIDKVKKASQKAAKSKK